LSEAAMSSQSCEKIKVFARVRPSKEEKVHKVVYIEQDNNITINLDNDPKRFEFDGVFGEDSQQMEVFNGAASRIVDGTLHGYNGTIFAYGQTGSGKTHTMIGSPGKFDSGSGIIPRGLHLLFNLLEQKTEEMPGQFSSKITISFVEIYNENIYDLFVMNDEKLKIGQDHDGNAIVKGATEVFVKDLNDAMEEVMRGWSNRSVAETAMNRSSSRSHALLLIKIRTEEVHGHVNEHGPISTARSAFLNLVDLAGSERVSQSKVEGDRLKETANINKSLLTLKIVINKLSERKSNGFIPFRNSMLTHILKDSLGGNARTAVMINLHPDKKYYSETLSTLLFSAEVRTIENKVVVNEDLKGDSVEAYKAEIKRLQEEMETKCNKSAVELAEVKSRMEAWMEAANKLERQLAVANRNAINAAKVARKDGLAASLAESIWNKTMEEVAETARNLPTGDIRSMQLRKLTEDLNLAVFEKDELQWQLNEERKAKGELQEKLTRVMEGTMSPGREKRTRMGLDSQGSLHESTVSSMLGSVVDRSSMAPPPTTPSSKKKDRRMTMYGNRQSNFFRPVLDLTHGEKEEGGTNPSMDASAAESEMREMELEMKINQQQQMIAEKAQEAETLTRLLKDAEKNISDVEERLMKALESCKEEGEKVKELSTDLEKAERTIGEERDKLVDLEKEKAQLAEQVIEAMSQVDRLQSDSALLKSTHMDELRELEERLKSNLTDKEKKEVDLKAEIDRLEGEIESRRLELVNKDTEKQAAEEVLFTLRDRLVHVEEERSVQLTEWEALTCEMQQLRLSMENEKKEMEEERIKREEEQKEKVKELQEEIGEKTKELEKMRIKMRQIGETSSTEFTRLNKEMEKLRIAKDAEIRQTTQHWQTVSHQFTEKMAEMREELSNKVAKLMEAEAKEKHTNEILRLSATENEELKENISALGSHANHKQKLHLLSRYVESQRNLQSRVLQLEGALQKHGVTIPRDSNGMSGMEEGEETEVRESAGSDVLTDNAFRRPTRVAASSTASAANSKTSVRSTRSATAARK
ncbi:hypothetical protein PENTCL1PPCAC_30672, partial [Pristionchus entomophagus]